MFKWVLVLMLVTFSFLHNSQVLPDYFLEAGVLGGPWLDSEFSVVLDFLSGVYCLMLLCCGLSVLVFCAHYFGGWDLCCGLAGMLIVFLGIMVSLSFSGSLILSLILWEYLGFVSFLLILYYSGMASLRASVITLTSSRLGDVGLFVLFCWWFHEFSFVGWIPCLSLFLVVASKSACYPLMSWLIEAMRAPTPVSALVHSSTLVAAGVWFLLRYGGFVSESAVWLLSMSCCVTVIFSSVCACFVSDIKKIVAFSTCNNISWCLLYYLWGDVVLAVCQLLIHGLCKSLLFMVVGDLMGSSGSSQSGVNSYSFLKVGGFEVMLSVVLMGCLSGLPLMGVFFTKHLFISMCLDSVSFLCWGFLVVGVFLSSVYCFRLLFLILAGGGALNNSYLCCFFLSCGLAWVSLGVCWLMSSFLEETAVQSSVGSVVLLLAQGFGCLVGWGLVSLGPKVLWGRGLAMISSIFGCDSLINGLYQMYTVLEWLPSIFVFRWEWRFSKWLLSFNNKYLHMFYSVVTSGCWVFAGLWILYYVWLIIS